MKIAAVVITCNRLPLLPRALKSIAKQNRKPDFVFVVSNSTNENFEAEKIICNDFGFLLTKNLRTQTYAGALNGSVEEIIKYFGIEDDVYFASLDDDDEWLPDYLLEIENNNADNFDLLIGSLLRKSETENELLTLPPQLTEKDFLIGNPGVCGSNTFIRLTTLLQAGCFDEATSAKADRDFLVRVFQQKPSCKIINKHLVTQYTDNNIPRETRSREKEKQSLQVFYYKYQHLMSETEKEFFFERVKTFFAVSREEIETFKNIIVKTAKQEIDFKNKGNYQFVIGFIAGNEATTFRIINHIIERNTQADLIVLVDNTPKGETLTSSTNLLDENKFNYKLVSYEDCNSNLHSGRYGKYFQKYPEINSIPLGRTILHHHLFTETTEMRNPVYWIIDDDVSFSATTDASENSKQVNLFEIINKHYTNADALIGSISNDPPVPTLSCIRGQLVDFLHSHNANNCLSADFLNVKSKPDYYYDLSDIHSDHLESPIYHTSTTESELEQIFSGKSVSRKALQKELKAENKTITKRGANTLVFNRYLLHYYPVINLEVNKKFARRGDLLWALLNQVVSNKKILEHTFSLDHNRPKTEFILKKELDKAGYDIIGYAFNKGVLEVIQHVKEETKSISPKDIFEKLNQDSYYQQFLKTYNYFLERRKTRFLMNYFRIIGLTKLLSKDFATAKQFYNQVLDLKALNAFHSLLADAQDEETLKSFFNDFKSAIENYNYSTSDLYKQTCQIFVSRIQEAKQEIENYQDKICNSSYSFSVDQNDTTTSTEQFLFTTSKGVFIYDALNDKYVKILDGKYYGLTKHQNIWIASRSNNKGDRNHIENNRISDICSFSISSNYKVQNLKVLLYGIPGEIHQIDIANHTLFIPHTDFNQVLFIDIDTCLNSTTPKSIIDCNNFELDIYPHSHLNSVFISNDNLHLISHNFTMKTGKLSDWVIVNLNSLEVQTIPLNAHSAHNIYVKEQDYFFCDSNNKILYKNQLQLFKANKLLRGLSLTSENIFIGGSDICFDNFKRFSNNPSIYILDSKTGLHLKTINFLELGDIYEIRQLNKTDYSLSQNNY